MTKTEETLQRMGHEMKMNPPAILAKTKKKKGKAMAEKQRKAILLSKARRAGARIPRKKEASHDEMVTAVHQATS